MTENSKNPKREDKIIISEISAIIEQLSFPDDFFNQHFEFMRIADKLLALVKELSKTEKVKLKNSAEIAAHEIFLTINKEVSYIEPAYKEMNKRNAPKKRTLEYKQSIRNAAHLLCSDARILTTQ
jgi:hypothetical protein